MSNPRQDFALGLISYEEYKRLTGVTADAVASIEPLPTQEVVEEPPVEGSTSLPAQLYRGVVARTREALGEGLVDLGATIVRKVTTPPEARGTDLFRPVEDYLPPAYAETEEGKRLIAEGKRIREEQQASELERSKKITETADKIKAGMASFYDSITPDFLKDVGVEVSPELQERLSTATEHEREHAINMEMWKQRPLEQAAGVIGGGIASMAAPLAVTYITKNPKSFLITSGIMQGTSIYEDAVRARDEGKKGILDDFITPEQAAVLGGAFTAVSEKFFMAKELAGLSKPLIAEGAKAFLKNVGKASVKEGLQEVLEQVQQNLTAKLGYDEGTLLYAGLLDSYVGGAGAGGGLGVFSQSYKNLQVQENEQRRYLWNEKMKREFFAMQNEDGTPLYDATTINGLLEPLERLGAAQNFDDVQMDKMFTLVTGREAPVDPTELAAMVTERSALAKEQGWVDIKLDSAKRMENSGKSAREIWAKTGWWNFDGVWYYELPKDMLSYKFNDEQAEGYVKNGVTIPISELVSSPELFKSAPYISNLKVEFVPQADYMGQYDQETGTIRVGTDAILRNADAEGFSTFASALAGTLEHEIQHAISNNEGGYTGTSPESLEVRERMLLVKNNQEEARQVVLGPIAKKIPRLDKILDNVQKLQINTKHPGYVQVSATLYDGKVESWTEPSDLRGVNVDFDLTKPTRLKTYQSELGELLSEVAMRRNSLTMAERAGRPPWKTLQELAEERGLDLSKAWDARMYGQDLPQQQGGTLKGTFSLQKQGDVLRRIITLTKSATRDTFLHEVGHAFMTFLNVEQLAILASQQGVPVETLLKYVKGEQMSVQEMLDVRKAAEPFANSFVRYLAEGISPIPSLTNMFNRLSFMLRTIFGTASRVNGAESISPELRKMYASLLVPKTKVQGWIRPKGKSPYYKILHGGDAFYLNNGRAFIIVRDERETDRIFPLEVTNLIIEGYENDERFRGSAILEMQKEVLGEKAEFIPTDWSGVAQDDSVADIGFKKYLPEELESFSDRKLKAVTRRVGIKTKGLTREQMIQMIFDDGRFVTNSEVDLNNGRVDQEDEQHFGKSKWIVGAYALNVMRNLSFRFPELQGETNKAMNATRRAHQIDAYLGKRMRAFQELVSGKGKPNGWRISSKQMVKRMMKPILLAQDGNGDKAWMPTYFSYIDNRYSRFGMAELTKEEQDVKKVYANLYDSIGELAENGSYMFQGTKQKGLMRRIEKKVTQNGKTTTVYVWEPVKRHPGLMQRVFGEGFFELLHGADEADLKRLASIIARCQADANPKLAAAISGIRDEQAILSTLRSMRTQFQTGRPMSMENISTIAIMPSTVEIRGKLYKILESDPYNIAESTTTSAALRFGFLSEFDTDPDKIEDTYRELAKQAQGQEKLVEYGRLIRVLNGQPMDLSAAKRSPFQQTAEFMRAGLTLLRAGLFTNLVMTNMWETYTKVAPFLGDSRFRSAWKELGVLTADGVKAALKKSDLNDNYYYRRLVELGAISQRVQRSLYAPLYQHGHFQIGSALRAKAHWLSQRILYATGGIGVNEMNEIIAGIAAMKMTEDIVSGREVLTEDIMRLKRFGYTNEQISIMTSGVDSPSRTALLNTVPQAAVAATQNTNLLPAEVSKMGNRKWYNDLVIADSFTRNTLGQLLLLGKDVYDAERAKRTGKEKFVAWKRYKDVAFASAAGLPGIGAAFSRSASAKVMRHYVQNHYIAAAGTMLLRFIALGTTGLALVDWDDEDDGILDDMFETFQELNSFAFLGGIMGSFLYSNQALKKTGNPFVDVPSAAVNATFPANKAAQLYQAISGTGGYVGLDTWETAHKYITDNITLSKHAKRLLTMVAGNARANDMDYAERQYFEFRRKYMGFSGGAGNAPTDPTREYKELLQARKEARAKAKRAVRLMELQEFYGEDHYAEIVDLLHVSDDLLYWDDNVQTGDILRTRTLRIPEEHREAWEKFASPRVQELIEDWNAMVEDNI